MSIDVIRVKLDGKPEGEVSKSAYVTAKTKQLQEFGYPNLTDEETSRQIEAILKGEKLNVIGMFMEDEIIVPKQPLTRKTGQGNPTANAHSAAK